MCYRGSVTDVPELLESIESTKEKNNFLRFDQPILGIAAGPRKVRVFEAFETLEGIKEYFDPDGDAPEYWKENLTNINKWVKYDKKSKVALVMSNYADQGDGTELEATEIPPCPEK